MSAKVIVQTMPLADLVEDMDIYPRHAVDASNVQSLAQALDAGATLPPIIADKKSKRIVDGWHRARAHKRIHGPTATVDVELHPYKNEAAIKYDAVARNSQHGRRLDSIDRTRSVVMLRTSGFSDGQIAGALNVPEDRVQKIAIKVAEGPKNDKHAVPGTHKITLKRSVAHMEGRKLSKSQAAAHAKLPGTSFLLIARQLCLGLKEGLIDTEDEKLMAQLQELRDLLVEKL